MIVRARHGLSVTFVPPNSSALVFDLTNRVRRGNVSLTISFIPAEPDSDGNLVPVFGKSVAIGTWDLVNNSSLPFGKKQMITLPLQDPGPLGKVGTFRFELRAIDFFGRPIRASIDLDNVRLVSSHDMSGTVGSSSNEGLAMSWVDLSDHSSSPVPATVPLIGTMLAGVLPIHDPSFPRTLIRFLTPLKVKPGFDFVSIGFIDPASPQEPFGLADLAFQTESVESETGIVDLLLPDSKPRRRSRA